MNLLSHIFRKQKSDTTDIKTANPVLETVTEDPEVDVLEDLFVDSNPPQPPNESAPQNEADSQSDNILKRFLDKDYATRGFNDGYETRSVDVRDNHVRRMRAEYRYVLDQVIDQKNREIFALRNELIITGSIADRVRDQLNLRIDELAGVIKKLEKEKELSVDDEGLIMGPIHNYREAFQRGAQTYLNENIFASSTGLFS